MLVATHQSERPLYGDGQSTGVRFPHSGGFHWRGDEDPEFSQLCVQFPKNRNAIRRNEVLQQRETDGRHLRGGGGAAGQIAFTDSEGGKERHSRAFRKSLPISSRERPTKRGKRYTTATTKMVYSTPDARNSCRDPAANTIKSNSRIPNASGMRTDGTRTMWTMYRVRRNRK